jgi:hypothetical protein
MSSMAGAGLVTVSETESEELPVSPGLALAEPPSAAQRDPLRPLASAQCSLCGTALPLGLLVPDGGQACADIRWYCKDARSCTERWTTAGPRARANTQAVPGSASTDGAEATPDAVPGGTREEAKTAAAGKDRRTRKRLPHEAKTAV